MENNNKIKINMLVNQLANINSSLDLLRTNINNFLYKLALSKTNKEEEINNIFEFDLINKNISELFKKFEPDATKLADIFKNEKGIKEDK